MRDVATDALLAEYERESASRTKVEIVACAKPPSPRVNFTFLAHPTKDELLLFGGEYFNGMFVSVCARASARRKTRLSLARAPLPCALCWSRLVFFLWGFCVCVPSEDGRATTP